MKIQIDSTGVVNFNCRTNTKGGSSANQFTGDSLTEVYYGYCVSVRMFDLGISIEMDPYPGQWKDPIFAREQAIAALIKNISVDDLSKIICEMRILGQREGKELARSDMRSALGIFDD